VADLATLAEFEEFLGGTVATEATLRQSVLDMAEAMFERACGRAHIPFVAAQTARVEYRDGSGSNELYLDYPVSALTTITLGFDHAAPTETLVVADLLYAVGERRIVRTDGGFGCFGAPRYVKATYNAQADLPADAKLAVLTGAASLYQRKGAEGVKSETMGPYSITYRDDAGVVTLSPVWEAAVMAHARVI
jgi:hypothetical protein